MASRIVEATAANSLYAEVAADGAHGRVGRLRGTQHLAPLEHDVNAGPHHAHHGSRRLKFESEAADTRNKNQNRKIWVSSMPGREKSNGGCLVTPKVTLKSSVSSVPDLL